METLYRVEKSNGDGPYHSSGYSRLHGGKDCDYSRHPCPNDDGLEGGYDRYGFEKPRHGFESLEKFREWFRTEERTTLAAFGYLLVVYECDRTQHGRKQLVFDLDCATKVSEHNPTEF